MKENTIPDYITFGRTFEKYKWYKPLLVLITGFIIYCVFQFLTIGILSAIYGTNVISPLMAGNYETLNSNLGNYIAYLIVGLLLPSLYIATRIVNDRPFSSYSSSRGGWNWKLYFKCLLVPLAVYGIFSIINCMMNGKVGPNTFTVTFLIICLILVPLQSIAEEYVTRGFVMQTIGSWFNIPILSLVVQTILFTILHPYNIWGLMALLIQGFLYGFLAWKTNGLEASSAIHTINNLGSTIIIALGYDLSTSTISPIVFVEAVIISLICTTGIYYIGNKYDWFSEKTSESKLI